MKLGLPEFNRKSLEVMRQPLEEGKVTISRALTSSTSKAPGQNAGWLGPGYDPLVLTGNPAMPGFSVTGTLGRTADVSASRLQSRRALLERINRATGPANVWPERALDLLTSPTAQRAFDLAREPAGMRDRYGRHIHGQSVLLAQGWNRAPARRGHRQGGARLQGRHQRLESRQSPSSGMAAWLRSQEPIRRHPLAVPLKGLDGLAMAPFDGFPLLHHLEVLFGRARLHLSPQPFHFLLADQRKQIVQLLFGSFEVVDSLGLIGSGALIAAAIDVFFSLLLGIAG